MAMEDEGGDTLSRSVASTRDTDSSGISIIDEFWVILQPAYTVQLLEHLEATDVSSLVAADGSTSEFLSIALLHMALSILSAFFAFVRSDR